MVTRGAHRFDDWLSGRAASRIVQVGMILLLVVSCFLFFRQSQTVDCMEKQEKRTTAALVARTEAADKRQEALAVLFREALKGGPSARAAIEAYLVEHENDKRVRAENRTQPSRCP